MKQPASIPLDGRKGFPIASVKKEEPESSVVPGGLGIRDWIVLAFLTLCSLGLNHDLSGKYDESSSVEMGYGIDSEEKFAKDVGAAPIGRQLGFAGLFVVIGACWVMYRPNLRVDAPILLFLSLCVIGFIVASLFWSTQRGETIREIIRILVFLLTGYSISRSMNSRTVCLFVLFFLLFAVGLAAGFDIVAGNFRPWRGDYRMQGTFHANELARQATLLAVGSFALMSHTSANRLWRIVFIFALVVVFLTKSRTGLVSMGVGLIAVQMMKLNVSSSIGFASLGMFLAASGLLMFAILDSATKRSILGSSSMGREVEVGSLTGRIPLWEEVLDQSKNQYLLGGGYGAFWTTRRTQEMGDTLHWYPRHSHSIYIETLVNVGIVGFAMVFLAVLLYLSKCYSKIWSGAGWQYGVFASFTIVGLVNGLAEAAFILPRDSGILNAILLFAVVLCHSDLRYIDSNAVEGMTPELTGSKYGLDRSVSSCPE